MNLGQRFCCVGTGYLEKKRKVGHTLHGTFEMWCWRRLEDISWTDHVRNAEVLQRVEWGINIVQIMKRKANCTAKIWHANCLLNRITEENIEGRI